MRAYVYDPSGAKDMVFDESAPRPAAGKLRAGQLLVDVRAVSLNPVDYKKFKMIPFSRFILGGAPVAQDFAGVVKVSQAPEYKAGDRVFGVASGCLAEQVIASASDVAPMPAAMTYADAAAHVTAALTSIGALELGGVTSGSRVMVVGASGGVGTDGVQIARALVGATGSVVGVCSASSADVVRSLGADAVIDYTVADPLAPLRAAGAAPFDAIFDTVSSGDAGDNLKGTPYAVALRPHLKPGGTIVAINGTPGQWLGALSGFHASDYELYMMKTSSAALRRAAAWASEGRLRAVIDSAYPFTAAGCEAAYDKLKSRRAKGKVVVNVSGDNGGAAAAQ